MAMDEDRLIAWDARQHPHDVPGDYSIRQYDPGGVYWFGDVVESEHLVPPGGEAVGRRYVGLWISDADQPFGSCDHKRGWH